ncbi:MAG: M3 family metallopeptidase [Elusimicrobiota bacterium]
MRTLLLVLLAASFRLPASAQTLPPENPFSQPSALPYQYPPFDKIKNTDYRPAFEAGMAEQLREIAAIAQSPAPPTFDNTIAALERSGALLNRVNQTFYGLNAANTDDEMQKIAEEMAPRLAAHHDAIDLDFALFARVDALYKQRASLGLDPESSELLERYHKRFVRAGALLPPADKEQLKAMNIMVSSLTTHVEQNLLKNTKSAAVIVDDVAELDGLPAEDVGAAAEAAKERGISGKWLISLQNTTIQPALEQMKNRALRERVYLASISRGIGGEGDNIGLVSRIAALRAKQAALLGYPDYASYFLEEESAREPAAVNKMLGELGKAALLKAKAEAAEIQKLIDEQAKAGRSKKFKLQPWDWAFYAMQVRNARYGFDDAQVKPYFELERVLQDGVFYAAHELYGITMKERTDLPVYRPGVRVFDVLDADGSAIGLFVRDDYKRDNKNGGAWMDAFVDQNELLGQKPVISNTLNVPKPAEGQPVLLGFDDVTTMFHEFGHALHGLFSRVKYPMLSGTKVPRDFVEYPSQINEMWAREPAVVAHFARHYKTGEPMPKELLDKVIRAQRYGAGYATLEYIEAAMVDQAWHQIPASAAPPPERVMAFEKAALKKARMEYAPVPPRYHTPYFAHIFAGSYAAAYYAYTWAEVLARDSGEWFHTHGGLDRANGDFFRAKVLSRGRTMDPGVMFEQFYGRKPEVGPLLDYHGLR